MAWKVYSCQSCGGLVVASSKADNSKVDEIYPTTREVSPEVPHKARLLLKQALETQHAPAGCVMICGSAVDCMLKLKSLKEGTLYSRINQSTSNHR